jgi:hypothetical protein
VDIPLPWERLLWSGRPGFPHRTRARYVLTDFRLVSILGDRIDEVALHDIAEVQRTESRLDRLIGTSTIVVQPRRHARGIELQGVRRGAQLAALLEILSGEASAPMEIDAVKAALAWEPRATTRAYPELAGGLALLLIAIAAAVVGARGRGALVAYSPADPIFFPNGQKRSRAETVRFMEREVMPWARVTIGRIKGGPDRITCETCHGRNAEARDWQMPAVAALPEPDFRVRGWERYGGTMDAQMRNAIYGYAAEPEKQDRAGYMRELVMPGMAALLHRPPYDFTKPYDYNRSRLAFGCYHCHRVK